MAKLISMSIDVSKIDKSKLIKGEKGQYLNLTISLNDQKDNYGNDCSAWQSQSKEERDAKAQRNFLGNGKVVWSGESAPVSQGSSSDTDDLPF